VEIDVTSKVPARVYEVYVEEGQTVKRGQKLVALKSEEVTAKVLQARAASEAAQAKLRLARHGVRPEERQAVERELDASKHQLELAQKTYDRMSELASSGTIAQARFDEAKFRFDVAREQLAIVEAKRTITSQGARREELDALTALVEQSRGLMTEVQAYEAETLQVAAMDGEVSEVILQPGELAGTGAPILSLVAVQNPWVTFALREDLLRRAEKGTEFQAKVPALGKSACFRVYHVAPMGDFATWKATTQKNDFDLKSFQIKARPCQALPDLRPGMTVRWDLR
jgi:HlyD family secretion protein